MTRTRNIALHGFTVRNLPKIVGFPDDVSTVLYSHMEAVASVNGLPQDADLQSRGDGLLTWS